MLTKNDMARVIVQALYSTDNLPARDNINVKRITRNPKEHLKSLHSRAMNILNAKVKANNL